MDISNAKADRAATRLVKELLAMPVMLAPPGSVEIQGESTGVDEILSCIELELSNDNVDVQKLRSHFQSLKNQLTGSIDDETCCGETNINTDNVLT